MTTSKFKQNNSYGIFQRSIVARFTFVLLFCITACKQMIPSGLYPYSMIQFQEGKFIDETEITVEQYAEFVYDGHRDRKPDQDKSKQYKYHPIFYPDHSTDSIYRAFGKIDYYQLPVIKEYFDTLTYHELREILDFPITGISHQDALAYCQWRTEKYNVNNATHTAKRIDFVLPDSVVYLVELPKSIKKYEASDLTIYPVKAKKHALLNGYRVYGLQSNVAEMTATRNEYYGQLTPLNNELEAGFRCVGIVSE